MVSEHSELLQYMKKFIHSFIQGRDRMWKVRQSEKNLAAPSGKWPAWGTINIIVIYVVSQLRLLTSPHGWLLISRTLLWLLGL